MAIVRISQPIPARKASDGPWRRQAWLLLLLCLRWMVTSNLFLSVTGTVVVGGSLALSIATDAWHWFPRSGALLASIGAILSTRRVLRVMISAMIDDRSLSEVVTSEGVPVSDDLTACFVGFWVVGFGTLIWAYGDLLGCALGSSCL